MRTYVTPLPLPVLCHAASGGRLLRDAPQEQLEMYFRRSSKRFMERMESFFAAQTFSEREERELRFMLEALLAAKHILLEDSDIKL